MNPAAIKQQVAKNGFAIPGPIYSTEETENILQLIESAGTTNHQRKSAELFAIRQFLQHIPEAAGVLFNRQLNSLISNVFGDGFFVVKSIYFDKPETSNWFVAYHQDLKVAVNKKAALEGFTNWTNKQNEFTVQPPLALLENNFTIRIHLDNTTEKNGALKVIPQSHKMGIVRTDAIDDLNQNEVVCEVEKGGLMLMKPLLLHASGRTINQQRRRVVHIEFSNQQLPSELQWAERYDYEIA